MGAWNARRGSKTVAAMVLGMSFSALRYRMKEQGIESSFRDSEHKALPQ
jgi:DNA-binding NtrC family response regulator